MQVLEAVLRLFVQGILELPEYDWESGVGLGQRGFLEGN